MFLGLGTVGEEEGPDCLVGKSEEGMVGVGGIKQGSQGKEGCSASGSGSGSRLLLLG